MSSKNLPYREEDLRFENEVTKLKLRAEFGTVVMDNLRSCPWREYEWLKDIEQFERKYAACEQVTVFAYLGEPQDIKPAKEVSRKELPEALENVQNLLRAHDIEVGSLCDISYFEMYRFIVEDVFPQKIDDIRSDGNIWRFWYEEFYPNDEYEVKVLVEDFLHKTFGNMWKVLEGMLKRKIQTFKPTPISKQVMLERLENWVSFYKEILLVDIQFQKIEVDHTEAVAAACITYEATLPGEYETTGGEILANFQLSYSTWDGWQITGIFIPGVQ